MKKVYLVVPQFKGVEEYDFIVDQEFSTKKEAEAYGEKNYPGIYEIEEVIENRHLLYIDIMGRIPYGTKFRFDLDGKNFNIISFNSDPEIPSLESIYSYWIRKGFILPYLRPMSSMTEEELGELLNCEDIDFDGKAELVKRAMLAYAEGDKLLSNALFSMQYAKTIDWLNAHHFDYRGLIEKGLAIEAPEGMYNTKLK